MTTTISAAVDLFLTAVADQVRPATLALYRHYLKRFADHFGPRTIGDITPAAVMSWSTKYHPLGCVRRFARWLTNDARLLPADPLAGMRAVRNGQRRRILGRGEVAQLMRACRPAFRLFVLGLVETIARPRELRAARWCDLRANGSPAWSLADLVAGRCYLQLAEFKGRDRRRDRRAVRVIPLPPRIGRAIARLHDADADAGRPIFVNQAGQAWTHNAVRLAMRRARKRAGLVADGDGENVVAYTLRHTAATTAVVAGVRDMTLAEIMGHSDIRMTQRYVHLVPDHLVKSAGLVSEWKQAQKRRGRREKD